MRRLFLTFIVFSATLAQAADPPAGAPPQTTTAPTTPAVTMPATITPPATVTPPPPLPNAAAVSPSAPAATTPPPATAAPNAATATAPIKDAETVITKDLAARVIIGRAVDLPVGGRNVLGLYTPQSAAQPKGAVVLLHDLGAHADWPGSIGELRRTLPSQGWSTLSVQLPVLGNGPIPTQQIAYLDQTAARIDVALGFIKNEGPRKVVLVGDGLGAVAALEYAAAHPETIDGVALIGMAHVRGSDVRLSVTDKLGKVTLPLLDLYGANDRIEVTDTATARREAAGHKGNYLQVVIPSANHSFTDQEKILTGRMRGWLDRHVAEPEKNKGEKEKTDTIPSQPTSANQST